jgi:hypothetical protein
VNQTLTPSLNRPILNLNTLGPEAPFRESVFDLVYLDEKGRKQLMTGNNEKSSFWWQNPERRGFRQN